MTCFWDGLRRELNLNISNEDFITLLKNNNKKHTSILWNNTELTNKQMEENFQHIMDYNINTIHNGYDCSVCDPFIILICQIYNVNITHTYNGYIMTYFIDHNAHNLSFRSDMGHFY